VIITRLFHLCPVERHVTDVDAEAGSSGRVTVDSDAEVKDEGAGKMVDEVTKINRLPKEKGSHPAAHKLKDVANEGVGAKPAPGAEAPWT
jgi:hypothetical protein